MQNHALNKNLHKSNAIEQEHRTLYLLNIVTQKCSFKHSHCGTEIYSICMYDNANKIRK